MAVILPLILAVLVEEDITPMLAPVWLKGLAPG
jgi:hypothetical protein